MLRFGEGSKNLGINCRVSHPLQKNAKDGARGDLRHCLARPTPCGLTEKVFSASRTRVQPWDPSGRY
jgi:hypothetical protein